MENQPYYQLSPEGQCLMVAVCIIIVFWAAGFIYLCIRVWLQGPYDEDPAIDELLIYPPKKGDKNV